MLVLSNQMQWHVSDGIRPNLQVRRRLEKLLNIPGAGIGIITGHRRRIHSLPPLIRQISVLYSTPFPLTSGGGPTENWKQTKNPKDRESERAAVYMASINRVYYMERAMAS